MATPMLLIGKDKQDQPQTKPEPPTKTRPRKTGHKNPNQIKKQPQRGLGVAQLERLRLQERWKIMTEMPPPPAAHHFQSAHSPFLLDPTLPNLPLHFAANDSAAGVLGFDQQGFVVQRIANGGFLPVEPYPHGGAAVDPRLLIGNSVEAASRELSSIPKFSPPPPPPPCVSDRCDICFKKKRVLNFNTTANKNNIAAAETPPRAATAGFDFLGISTAAVHGCEIPSNDQYPDFNFNQGGGGAEIKQIHRKAAGKGGGSSGSSNNSNNILMEYEFFPGKNGRGTEFEELEMPKEEELLLLGSFAEDQEVVVLMDHGEGSCITTSCTDIINGGTSTSSRPVHLDLSLKLSF